jgi:hypothetical protein
VSVENRSYPYESAISILDEWFKNHPEARGLRDKLTVSGLSSALKAAKRAALAQRLAKVAEVRVETELRIGRESKGDAKSQGEHSEITGT